MSRTRRGGKGTGYEYGSRRHPACYLDPGRESKTRTNRFERRVSKKNIEANKEAVVVCGRCQSHVSVRTYEVKSFFLCHECDEQEY